MGPSATHESGHFYFAQTGHSHFAATDSTRDVDFWPPKSVLSCNNLPCRPLPKTKMRRNTRGKTSRHVELLARHCLLRACSGVESMEPIRIVAAEEHGRCTNYLVHGPLQRRPLVFASDHCHSKLFLVQLADVSVLVRRLPHRRHPDHDQSEWHG